MASEPPSQYGAPSGFSSFSSGGGGGYDDGGNDGAQYVDSELLARVAQILEQSEASSRSAYSSPSSSYGAPPSDSYGAPPPSDSYGAPPSSSYGAPSRSSFGGSSGITLGRPERAERVAAFDLSGGSGSRGGFRSGGYN